MKQGDFIRIDYVARIKEGGEIFDLTKEDVAKEKDLYNPEFNYRPVPVVIGAGFIVRGLERELKKMKVGDKKKVIVKPEQGFGQRNPKLIKLFSLSEFRKKDIDPYPGMPVKIHNLAGKVLSVSGGRVRVDFNHPLAGKELEYDVEVKAKITNKKEKVKAIVEVFTNAKKDGFSVSFDDAVAEVKHKLDLNKSLKEKIADTVRKWIDNVKKVRFVEEY